MPTRRPGATGYFHFNWMVLADKVGIGRHAKSQIYLNPSVIAEQSESMYRVSNSQLKRYDDIDESGHQR